MCDDMRIGLDTIYRHWTDRQTDRQTDRNNKNNVAICTVGW